MQKYRVDEAQIGTLKYWRKHPLVWLMPTEEQQTKMSKHFSFILTLVLVRLTTWLWVKYAMIAEGHFCELLWLLHILQERKGQRPFCIIPNRSTLPHKTPIPSIVVAVRYFYIWAGEMATDIKQWPSAMGHCLYAQTRQRRDIHQYCYCGLVALVCLGLESSVFQRPLQESRIWFEEIWTGQLMGESCFSFFYR